MNLTKMQFTHKNNCQQCNKENGCLEVYVAGNAKQKAEPINSKMITPSNLGDAGLQIVNDLLRQNTLGPGAAYATNHLSASAKQT